jgi:hypothetical protein
MSTVKVCLLGRLEVEQLEHYDQTPSCKRHRHISKREADERVGRGELVRMSGPGRARVSWNRSAQLERPQVVQSDSGYSTVQPRPWAVYDWIRGPRRQLGRSGARSGPGRSLAPFTGSGMESSS